MARLIAGPSDGGQGSGRISRRGLLGVGLGVVGAALLDGCTSAPAGAPAANQQPPSAPATEDALYQAAKQEGKVVWWTAHYAQSAADAVRDAFVAKYPGIEVEFIRQTAQVIYQRLTQNLQAGVR